MDRSDISSLCYVNEDDNDDYDCEDHLGREPSRAAVSVIAAKLVSSSGTPGERFLQIRQKSAMG